MMAVAVVLGLPFCKKQTNVRKSIAIDEVFKYNINENICPKYCIFVPRVLSFRER